MEQGADRGRQGAGEAGLDDCGTHGGPAWCVEFAVAVAVAGLGITASLVARMLVS